MGCSFRIIAMLDFENLLETAGEDTRQMNNSQTF